MSLNKKLDLAFFGVLLAFALLLIFFDTIFIDRFYIYQKRNSLSTTYSSVATLVQSEGLDTAKNDPKINDYRLDNGVMIVLFDVNGTVVFGGYQGIDSLADLKIVDSKTNTLLDTADEYNLYLISDGTFINFDDALQEPNNQAKGKNIAKVGKVVSTANSDETLCYIAVFTPYLNAQSNTSIFNAFILYSTVVILILSLIVVYFLSNRLTKPIKEAEEKTRKIANLDFSTKLDVQSHDEIGSLSLSINKMSDELEKNINDLKAANAALEKDLELKEKINTMREEFISDVSHELKTPISIINGYSEALKLEGLTQDDINGYADIIIDESAKMNKLVRDLIKYTQIESGFLTLDKEDFQVKDIIDSVIKPTDLEVKEKEVTLKVNVPDITVNGDYDMLESVFSNFYSNALHYVDGNRIIEVFGEIKKDKLRITVKNTGIQISEENQKRIWDSFFKVDKARTRAYGGTGLGLAIVKTIMESYQNEFGVYNNSDGVSFYFDLNVAKVQNTDGV